MTGSAATVSVRFSPAAQAAYNAVTITIVVETMGQLAILTAGLPTALSRIMSSELNTPLRGHSKHSYFGSSRVTRSDEFSIPFTAWDSFAAK